MSHIDPVGIKLIEKNQKSLLLSCQSPKSKSLVRVQSSPKSQKVQAWALFFDTWFRLCFDNLTHVARSLN